VFHKKRTSKAGRHEFIKISSPKMIFHPVHCHSVGDSLRLKSLVWAEYQLHGFHDNKSRQQLYVINKMIWRKRTLFWLKVCFC